MFVAIAQLLFVSSFLLSTAGGVSTPEGIKKYMNQLNGHRSRVAKRYHIANMNSLSWDNNLALEAASLPCDSDAYDHTPITIMAYFQLPQPLTPKEEDEIVKKALVGFVPPMDALSYRLHRIHPVQTRIGCVATACPITIFERQYHMEALCVLGPHSVRMDHLFKRGPAGSACGSARAINGLCGSWDNNVGVPVKHVASSRLQGSQGSVRTLGGSQGLGGSKGLDDSPSETTTASAAGLSIALSLFLFFVLQLASSPINYS